MPDNKLIPLLVWFSNHVDRLGLTTQREVWREATAFVRIHRAAARARLVRMKGATPWPTHS